MDYFNEIGFYRNVKNEDINSLDKYVKLFFSILNTIEERYNFNIEKYKILKDKKCPSSAGFILENGKIVFHIELGKYNKERYLHDSIIEMKNLLMFFNSLDITSDDSVALATYVFVILHELGHIFIFNKYKKKLKKMWILDQSIECANILFHSKPKTQREYDLIYTNFQRESNADVFAYQNFYWIWKKLNLNNFDDKEENL